MHVHALGVQRFVKAPVRVNGSGIRFGVAKHGLADRDVLRRVVRPRAQAVPEAMPTKTLTFGDQAQLNRGWLGEFGIHGLTPGLLLAIEVRGSEHNVFVLSCTGFPAATGLESPPMPRTSGQEPCWLLSKCA